MADLTFLSPPRISPDAFARVLIDARSPARDEALACYTSVAGQGVDPAIALAFFRTESTYATDPGYHKDANHNPGNIKGQWGDLVGHDAGGFAIYATWAAGFRAWALLITELYVRQRGLTTVEAAVPVYAPSFDRNSPARYIATVRASVAAWAQEGRHMAGTPMLVIGDGTRVRGAPNLNARILLQLPAGARVVVDHAVNDDDGGTIRWARIVEPIEGYVALYLLRAASR
jgi:hypothetical protein